MGTIILCGGGTGGHIYPALAIGEGLKKAYPDENIVYAGTPGGLEKELATQAGFPFIPIAAAGLPGKLSWQTAKNLLTTWQGYRQAKKMVKKIKPVLVVGTGGYVCAPVVMAAAKAKVPTLLHEQNAVAGKANRMLAHYVDKICLTFAEAAASLPESAKTKTVWTGLPIRACFWQTNRIEARQFFHLKPEKITVFVTGGSQGAQKLNRVMAAVYAELLAENVQIIHAVGKKNIAEMQKVRDRLEVSKAAHLLLYPYLTEMDQALAAADVVISRAGASFLTELAAVGRAAILVPYPFAANDHQRANALALTKSGAAVLLEDKELNEETFLQALRPLLQDREKRTEMAKKMAGFGQRNALTNIVAECTILLKKEKQ